MSVYERMINWGQPINGTSWHFLKMSKLLMHTNHIGTDEHHRRGQQKKRNQTNKQTKPLPDSVTMNSPVG